MNGTELVLTLAAYWLSGALAGVVLMAVAASRRDRAELRKHLEHRQRLLQITRGGDDG